MRTLMTYPLPTGPRAIVLVYVQDGDHPFTLLDIPAHDPLPRDGDCRVVDHELDDEGQAYDVAIAHMLRSERIGRPVETAV